MHQISYPLETLCANSSLDYSNYKLAVSNEVINDRAQNMTLLWSGNSNVVTLSEPAYNFEELMFVGGFNNGCTCNFTIKYDPSTLYYITQNGYYNGTMEYWYNRLTFANDVNSATVCTGHDSRYIYTYTSKNPSWDSTNRAVNYTRVYGINRISEVNNG